MNEEIQAVIWDRRGRAEEAFWRKPERVRRTGHKFPEGRMMAFEERSKYDS